MGGIYQVLLEIVNLEHGDVLSVSIICLLVHSSAEQFGCNLEHSDVPASAIPIWKYCRHYGSF